MKYCTRVAHNGDCIYVPHQIDGHESTRHQGIDDGCAWPYSAWCICDAQLDPYVLAYVDSLLADMESPHGTPAPVATH